MRATTACIVLAAAVLAAPALAQPEGIAISVPMPDLDSRKFRRYEVVELSGAMPVDGSLLVDGHLPAVVVDYVSQLGSLRQRASIFENGVVSIELSGVGGRVEKKVLLPADALRAYREFFASCDLDSFRPIDHGSETDQVLLRLATTGGATIEKRFPATSLVPENVERMRLVLDDLLRALSEDREVTNPISLWKPRVGDTLLGGDQKRYTVVRILDGQFIELLCATEPVRRFVPVKDLHLYFVGSLPSEH
ncbi:MAG TPA: hypothetical protein VGF40_01565 [Thermoanaerobaculia bacterium]